jgi:hypothetical protein
MSTFQEANLKKNDLVIGKKIDKKKAMWRIQHGYDVYATRSNAHTLSSALSDGQASWRDGRHVANGYPHYHDGNHIYRGHIFYGQPG